MELRGLARCGTGKKKEWKSRISDDYIHCAGFSSLEPTKISLKIKYHSAEMIGIMEEPGGRS